MKHLRYLLMAALVAMPLTACDEDDGPTVVEPDIGTITGTVSVAGTGLAGIDVTLVGATSQSVQTSASGQYTFANVEAGSYGVTISNIPAGVSFSSTSKTTAITTDGQTVTVDFTGSYIETSSIIGTVTVAGQGINGVTVALTGTETGNSVSANGGNFTFTGLRAGSYTVTISNIPTAYTFQTLSYNVTLGVGEAKAVAFVGAEVVTVDPVSAKVVIKSVTTGATNVPVNPAAVVGQVDVTLQIDPGENDLTKIALLLDGVEVASQALAAPVAGDLPQEQGGVFEVVFSINTAAFAMATGTPTYPNKAYTLSAELGLANAEEASVVTSTTLTFANPDIFIATANVPAAKRVIGANGFLYYGGDVPVTVLPVAYSGLTVSSVTIQFSNNGAPTTFTDGTAPFEFTIQQGTSSSPKTLWNYQTAAVGTDFVRVVAAQYSNGTTYSFPAGNPGFFAVTNGTAMTIDNVAPPAVAFTLTEQVSGSKHPACCANNWVNPNYAFAAGLATFADNANGVGGVTSTFHMGAATLSQSAIAALPAIATPGESGLGPSLVNTEYEVVAVLMDALGNKTAPIALSASAGGDNGASFVGHDAQAPQSQALAAGSQTDKMIYNAANLVAGSPVTFTATEDRAGFSATPLRMWVKLTKATSTSDPYLVGASSKTGGYVNEAMAVPACNGAAPANGAPCMPDGTMATNGIYTLTGHLVDQAGNEVATDITRMIMKDGTPPTTQNVSIPTSVLVAGASTPFGYNVSDDLHLWEVSLGFDYGLSGIYLPFGDPVPVGDSDKWDANFPTNAQSTMNVPLIVGIQTALGGAITPATTVRAVTTDAAGNQSGNANAFAAGTVPAGTTINGTTFGITALGAAFNLCNGLGTTACPTTTGNGKSVTIQVTATGASGTYVNPFLGGRLYFYHVIDGDATPYNAAPETFFLMGSIDGNGGLITDDGTTRTYTWSFTLTSAMVENAPLAALNVLALGTSSKGTGILSAYNTQITVINGN